MGKVYGIRPDQIEATVDALECGLSWDEFNERNRSGPHTLSLDEYVDLHYFYEGCAE